MRIVNVGTGSAVEVPILTRMAAAIHTTQNDAHVVFDKTGDVLILSEVWVPREDGFMLRMTKGKHEHRVVDVPR